MTLILSNDDVEQLLTMRDCIEAMEEAYVELAEGRGVSRTRSDCFTPTARADALYSLKSHGRRGARNSASAPCASIPTSSPGPKSGNTVRRVKVPAAPNNRYVGLVLLFSVENGEPLAILPDGVMQRMRVGAANGLGIKYLARKDAKTRRHPRLRLAGGRAAHGGLRRARHRNDPLLQPQSRKPRGLRHGDERARSASRSRRSTSRKTRSKGADIVMCATQFTIDPIFFERWIEPGMHLSSIKRPGDRDRRDQACRPRRDPLERAEPDPCRRQGRGDRGEGARAAAGSSPRRSTSRRLPTLPELIAGRVEGRESDDGGDLLHQQSRARLSVRRRRLGRLPQGERAGPRPRTADRLVHRRRASLMPPLGRA